MWLDMFSKVDVKTVCPLSKNTQGLVQFHSHMITGHFVPQRHPVYLVYIYLAAEWDRSVDCNRKGIGEVGGTEFAVTGRGKLTQTAALFFNSHEADCWNVKVAFRDWSDTYPETEGEKNPSRLELKEASAALLFV